MGEIKQEILVAGAEPGQPVEVALEGPIFPLFLGSGGPERVAGIIRRRRSALAILGLAFEALVAKSRIPRHRAILLSSIDKKYRKTRGHLPFPAGFRRAGRPLDQRQ